MACSGWRARQPPQNHPEWMGTEAAPNRKGQGTDKKWTFTVTSHHSSFISRQSLPCSHPQTDAISQSLPDSFRLSCCTPFLKWPLSCFRPFAPQDQLMVIFSWRSTLTLSQPYSHWKGFALKLTEIWGCVWGPNKSKLCGSAMLAAPTLESGLSWEQPAMCCVGWGVKCHLVQNKRQCQRNPHPHLTGTEWGRRLQGVGCPQSSN